MVGLVLSLIILKWRALYGTNKFELHFLAVAEQKVRAPKPEPARSGRRSLFPELHEMSLRDLRDRCKSDSFEPQWICGANSS